MQEIYDVLTVAAFEALKILLPVLTAFLINLARVKAKQWMEEIKSRRPNLHKAMIVGTRIAVAAAEQAEAAKLVENKKDYALDVAQEYLDSKGFEEINLKVLDAIIEAEVAKLNSKGEPAYVETWDM